MQKTIYDPQWKKPKHTPTLATPYKSFEIAEKNAFGQKFRRLVADLTRLVGPPFYARHGYILYHMDALVFLQKLASSCIKVDLTVTSPPYNLGMEYEESHSLDSYLSWCCRWLDGLFLVGAASSSFWLNLGYIEIPGKGKAVPISYLLWDKSPFYLQQEIVWHYPAGVACRKRFSPRNEKWLYYTKDSSCYTFNLDHVRDPNVKYPNQKRNGKYRCHPLGKNPGDVWDFSKVTGGRGRQSRERSEHPAQYPLNMIDRIVKASSRVTDIVLDPFNGSGTTGIAAIANGRIFIGCDVQGKYCDIARKRVDNYLNSQPNQTGV